MWLIFYLLVNLCSGLERNDRAACGIKYRQCRHYKALRIEKSLDSYISNLYNYF